MVEGTREGWMGRLRWAVAMVRDQGIVVRHWDWSETSQTVSIFCRELGVLRGIAKGAKREKSNFSGGLELATRGEVLGNVKGVETLALLTAWDLRETFPAAGRSLAGFHATMLVLDVLHHGLRELDPHPGLWDAALGALRWLDRPRGPRLAVARVLWAVLDQTGHGPELDRDARSGGELRPAATYGFAPEAGGLVADDGSAWRVRAETVGVLRGLREWATGPILTEDVGDAGPQPPVAVLGASEEAVDRASRLLALWYRQVFGVQPGAMEAYFGPLEVGKK